MLENTCSYRGCDCNRTPSGERLLYGDPLPPPVCTGDYDAECGAIWHTGDTCPIHELDGVEFPTTTDPTNQKENTTMSTTYDITIYRGNLIDAVQKYFTTDTDEINEFLEELGIEPIPTVVDIKVTYEVTVTYVDVPLGGRDIDDLDNYDMENLLDDDGRYPDFRDADDYEATEYEVAR